MNYVTESKLKQVMDRVGDKEYAEVDAVRSLFKVTNESDDNLCGNVRARFTKTGKARLGGTLSNSKLIECYEQISSALALYRSISLFKCGLNPIDCDFYKLNWSIHLKHKETGLILGLGEWKGGFQIFTPAYSADDLPSAYIRDVERLLTLLVSPKMPIGYDGTIAGTVA